MIPKKILKAIGKVLKHNGSHVDHHLRNLMQEIERHLARNPPEKSTDTVAEEVSLSTVSSDQVDRLSSSSSQTETTMRNQINGTMYSSGNKTRSEATAASRALPLDTAHAEKRTERPRCRKRRYIESEEEDDSTDSTGSDDSDGSNDSDGSDDSDGFIGDNYLTDSEDIYMGGTARRKPTRLPRDAKGARRSSRIAEKEIGGKHKERKHCCMCLGKVTGGCWLTNCKHVFCRGCHSKLPVLTNGSQRQCQHCGDALWKFSWIEKQSMKRYQRGRRISSRLAAQPMEEGRYAV